MEQHTLHPHPGSRKTKKRLGRGDSSGHGSFSTRGVKGQKSRSGGPPKPGFEGGQTPLLRRIPKFRGFTNPRRTVYQIINIQDLNQFDEGMVIDAAVLHERGLIKRKDLPVKLLGDGEITKKLVVKIEMMSKNAKAKLEKAGIKGS